MEIELSVVVREVKTVTREFTTQVLRFHTGKLELLLNLIRVDVLILCRFPENELGFHFV